MKFEDGSETAALLFALVHEVRNLLAATRLHASLIGSKAGAEQPDDAGRVIGALCERAGALLACMGPLTRPSHAARAVDPVELLDGVACHLDEDVAKRVEFDLAAAARCESVRCDRDTVVCVLLAVLLTALGESLEDVRVTAERDGAEVALLVEDAARRTEGGPMPCGLDLVESVAEAALRPAGGRVERDSDGPRSGTRLLLPVA